MSIPPTAGAERLLEHLRARLGDGRKLLVPYLMGGVPARATFAQLAEGISAHADAIEVGLPYSDPLMDGPVITAAGERAIASGIGPLDALDLAGSLKVDIPRIVMTYYNPIHRLGEDEFCRRTAAAGLAGLIVPDLPAEESGSLRSAAAQHGLAWIPLVAPTSSAERVAEVTATATGFVYAVSTLGVTGARDTLSPSAERVVKACREATELPVLVGIGVTTGEQAQQAARSADGVVVGSAVVARVQEAGVEETIRFVAELRSALDSLW